MKHNLKALRDLEKRLAEAKDRDLGLDGDILEVVDLASGVIAPPYTTSIDAAVALVGRVLPGWEWERKCETKRGKFVRLIGPEYHKYEFMGPHNKHCTAWVFGETPALALCLATVRALIAQGEVAP